METSRLVLISRHVVLSGYFLLSPHSQYACILIANHIIEEVVTVPSSTPVNPTQIEALLQCYQDREVLNYEFDYVMPGLIDLNVRPDREGITKVSKIAVEGGVTFFLEEDNGLGEGSEGEERLYADVGKAALVTLNSPVSYFEGAFALKAYLFQPGPSNFPMSDLLPTALEACNRTHLPLLLDLFFPPLSATMVNTPFRALPVIERQSKPLPTCDPAAFSDFPETPATADTADVFNFLLDSPESAPLKRSVTVVPSKIIAKEVSKRRKTTLEKDMKLLSQMEQSQYAGSGHTVYEKGSKETLVSTGVSNMERLRSRLKAVITKKDLEPPTTRQYLTYLANYPEGSDVDGVQILAEALDGDSSTPIHIINVSSEIALGLLLELKQQRGLLSLETAAHFLYFNAEKIQDGNTLLKCTPPIRDDENRKSLIERFKEDKIDSLSSGHVSFSAEEKDFRHGDFKRAVSGIAGLGCALQAAWTACRTDSEDENDLCIVRLSKAMALAPATVIGLEKERGSIEAGKFADLVVWQPYDLASLVAGLHPYHEEELMGKLKSVFLRGQRVHAEGVWSAIGRREKPAMSNKP